MVWQRRLAVAGNGWRRWGRATKAVAAGVECSYLFIENEFWVLLVVGKGQVRQARSIKYPPRKVYVRIKSGNWTLVCPPLTDT